MDSKDLTAQSKKLINRKKKSKFYKIKYVAIDKRSGEDREAIRALNEVLQSGTIRKETKKNNLECDRHKK